MLLNIDNRYSINEDVLGAFPYSEMRFSNASLEHSGTYTCTIHYQYSCGRPNVKLLIFAYN